MRVDQRFGHELPTISFEFSPPRTEEGFEQLYKTIDRLRPLQPSYVSVTYGAGGTTRQQTVEISKRIQNEIHLDVMAHLTCVEHTKEELAEILDTLWDGGIKNLLALRGDPPGGHGAFTKTEGGLGSARELVEFALSRHPFCVGVAGYPEGHIHCLNKTRDLEHLKEKVDAGASLIVTQLFFDNEDFCRWRDEIRAMGINVPLVAGIMPILNVAQIKRVVTMCGAKIPHTLLRRIESVETDKDAVLQIGTEYALHQCRDLLDRGSADGLHFYTMNRSQATRDICRALQGKVSV